MKVTAATASDADSVVDLLVRAFANDNQMRYFFGEVAADRRVLAREFFSILLGARMALGMPAHVLKDEERLAGLVMGYDTRRLAWPSACERRWQMLLERQAGLADRIDRVDQFVGRCAPTEPHFYLGVLGVDPACQGRGAGSRLIEAFCRLSDQYPDSQGVFLETAETGNAEYYQRRGFEPAGSIALNESYNLHCLFRPRHKQGGLI